MPEEGFDAIGADDGQPVGLLPARRNLCQKLIRRNARRCRQAGLGPYALLQLAGDRGRERFVPLVFRDVEVRFVERQRLDERRHLAENREHRIGCCPVAGEIRRDHDELGAEPHRSRHGHRRAHAERSGFVAGSRDDATPVRPTADGNRLSAQRGIVPLLDRRVERVHVHVDDSAEGRQFAIYNLQFSNHKANRVHQELRGLVTLRFVNCEL